MSSPKILHVLSQRPSLTGSGITLEAFVRNAAAAGWDQRVIVGVPASDPTPEVGGLASEHIHPLAFETSSLPFPVPGMSDVMPYRSTVWSTLSRDQLRVYREAWRSHLLAVLAEFDPDLIHSHHVWLLSALIKDVCPDIPVVTSCHATGLRQMSLTPHLAEEVRVGCARNDAFVVLQPQHATLLAEQLSVAAARIAVVGAGFREDLFHADGRTGAASNAAVYAGKYSNAKGLPQLLDVMDRLPAITLHVAGAGAGREADALAARMDSMPNVVRHGMLDQAGLSDLMRRCDVFVLPSFYEGVPLVLVEAVACGCRVVCTRLSGVEAALAPALGPLLQLVEPPAMASIDVPEADALPPFVDALQAAVADALRRPPLTTASRDALQPFTWSAVLQRVEVVWRRLVGDTRSE